MSYVSRGFLVLLIAGCGDDSSPPADTDDGTSSTTMSPVTSATTPSTSTTTPPTSSTTTVDPETGSTTGIPDPGTTTGEPDETSTGVVIEGIPVPFRLENLQDQSPFEDVDVCFLENPSCDVSDAMGEGELIGPIDTNLTFDLQNGGIFPTHYPIRFGMDGIDALLPALSTIQVGGVFLLLGYDAVPVEGSVAMLVVDEAGDPLDGATINISPPVPNPVYFLMDGTPDTNLTETAVDAGFGVFVEAGAGDYEAWVEHPTRDCVPSEFAWPGTQPDRAALTVVDNTVTVLFVFTCSPP